VRHALGASANRIVVEIISDTLRAIASGALIGWLISLLIEIHIARGVISLAVVVGVPALLFLVATVACWIPARRAANADPLIALRSE
jgi:ABC-type lipoprotein release transport system permease subunit